MIPKWQEILKRSHVMTYEDWKGKKPEVNITTEIAWKHNDWDVPERIHGFIDGQRVGYMNVGIMGNSYGPMETQVANEWSKDVTYGELGTTGLGRNIYDSIPSYINIHDTHINEEHRGKGVGKALVDKLIQELNSANLIKESTDSEDHPNFRKTWVNKTLKGHAPEKGAPEFWRKMGFKVDGDKIMRILD